MLQKLYSWNVNGIRSVEKKGFVEWLLGVQPDIIGLQETKAHTYQLSDKLMNVPGYYVYYSKPERKGYSGVALYSKIEPLKVTYGFGKQKFDTEGRVIMAEYEKFILFNIYFPNGQMSDERLAYKMEFYDHFLEIVDRLVKDGKNVIVCGDVNTAHKEIDLAHPKENSKISGFLPEERAWVDKFIAHGYVDTFREFNQAPAQYTWWSVRTRARERNVGWRIDYFFVNKSFMKFVKNSYILPGVEGSDHCPIALEIEV